MWNVLWNCTWVVHFGRRLICLMLFSFISSCSQDKHHNHLQNHEAMEGRPWWINMYKWAIFYPWKRQCVELTLTSSEHSILIIKQTNKNKLDVNFAVMFACGNTYASHWPLMEQWHSMWNAWWRRHSCNTCPKLHRVIRKSFWRKIFDGRGK